jgi:hypothetical protein
MRKALFITTLLLTAALASAKDAPPIKLEITPVNLPTDILYFPGPVALEFALTVTNPTHEPVTLKSLELRTVGPGAFTLRSGSVPANRTIPPNSSVTMTLSTWGHASGGYFRAEEPVSLNAIAYFSTGSKTFLRSVNTIITPR